jgi:tetratricopeptide (TPR) repeat protein
VAGSALAAAVALPVLLVSLVLVANSADRERSARLAADAARDEAEANFEKAVRSAELVSEELARGIKPIAGTQSKTVAEILTRAEAVYDDLLTGPHPPARARLNKAKMLVLSSDVYRGMHRLAPAGERATRAADLCRELLAEDPDGREYRTTLAAALHRRGWAVWERAQGGPALADFAEAIRLFDADGATAETAPDEAFALASCLTISGNIRLDFGDTAGAKPLYDRGLALREALSRKFPDDPRMRVQLAISLERVGLFERQFGKKAEGTAKLRRAVEATAAAFASDRGNQEVAVHYIRTLNSLAFAELEEDRPAALGRLKAARELAETFARRDPDSNEWERESVRARWTLGELEQEDWVRLPPEKRVEARKTQVRLLGEWIRVSDRRLGLSPEGGYWLSDRGNYRARLAVALLALADAGDEPAANRLRAVQVSALAVADYERVLAFEPKSYDQKTGLLYALSVAVKAAVASKPAAAALALHWRYAATSVRTYHDLCRDHPENPDGPRQLALALFGRVGVPRAFGDDWAKLAADPAALAAQIEFGEALPDRAALAFPKAAKLLAAVRERTGDQFRKVAEKTPLPERGKKLLESLSRKE